MYFTKEECRTVVKHKRCNCKNDYVIYIDNRGKSTILLDKYRSNNQDYKKQATRLAEEDLREYYKELNRDKGILQLSDAIYENIWTKKYTKEAQAKYNEFYIKHLEELCL